MKKDIGFWDINGNYIPDIQEIGAEEMDKNFNEFFDELNDMANFKNFGEKEEEIIIDGVNVAGCEHNYVVSNKLYCGADYECVHSDCENYPNCYYKQLKRLQQENAELKAENERLNRCLMEELHYEGKALRETIKYKQTLQEIKEIAEKVMSENLCNNCDGIGLDANCQDTYCAYYQMDKILQRIGAIEQ